MEDEDVELKLEDTRLPSDAAHDRTRTRTCCRRMSMCVVLSLMVVCGAIAGVVVYQQKIMNNTNSTVSGIQDGGGGPDITQAPSMRPSPSASPTRNPNTSSQSMTEEPSALPTSQPTGQPTDQPTGQPIEFTATPSVISSATDTTVISSVTSKDLMFLAFYYSWYERDDWSRHGTQGSTPLLGLYGSNEPEVAERHIDMAVRGGIDAWVVSWWRKDKPDTAYFVNGMLRAKNTDKIKFCMLYESKGALPVDSDFANGTLALDTFISDMIFFRDSYFVHPSYLHINGRPVVYVYLTRNYKNFEPLMLEKIKTAVGKDILFIADDPFFGHNMDPATAQNGIKDGKPVFEAYTAYNMYQNVLIRDGERAVDYMLREALPIYDKWSQETVFFPHVLPKYWDFREGHKPLVGDAAGLLTQLETFACLPRPTGYKNEFPDLIFVTTFNEWWEGTSIEPDVKDEYGYTFLDTIKAFKDSGVQCQEK